VAVGGPRSYSARRRRNSDFKIQNLNRFELNSNLLNLTDLKRTFPRSKNLK
jgi:hypothetical protein